MLRGRKGQSAGGWPFLWTRQNERARVAIPAQSEGQERVLRRGAEFNQSIHQFNRVELAAMRRGDVPSTKVGPAGAGFTSDGPREARMNS